MLNHFSPMNDLNFNRERNLKKIEAYIARMPSLSTTAIKVLETCNDPQASANELKRAVSLDPILTGRVLKLINSAYYSMGNPISSLTRAIIMLGVNTVKNLALSFAIIDNLKGKSSCRSFSTDEFWRHSLCVGVVAKSLAAIKGVSVTQREEFFVAGLLHDLGKLPLHMQFPEEYYRVCEAVRSGEEALCRNEVKYLGVDHGTVGRIITKKWHLGPTLVESLAYHHTPAEGSDNHREFVSVIALANQLAVYLDIGNAGDHFIDHSEITFLMGGVGVDWTMLDDLQETACDEIDRAKFFLEVIQDG
jgi:HD-like signal output (HDOD) protein